MSKKHNSKESIEESSADYTTYALGFILSLLLTLTAFFIVRRHFLTGWVMDYAVVSLGTIQVLVQLLFFLHLGNEPRPYWNLQLFLFMVLTVGILVGGSLWIMNELDYRTMGKM